MMLFGAKDVGKTSVIRRYILDDYSEEKLQ